ncbi:MAG: hypothetical protein HFJ28_00265 [Clostridia bacterium]|nr:hypothetical protein [Clostridia bacterium]
MKIQHIAIIFIIIILPISMTVSAYIDSQIETIQLQAEYNAKLTDATYDAVKAFQINTVNNRYSSVSDSKIRDVEASVNTFYTSLASNEDMIKEELRAYVPALVFTLYDGYYIYSKYDNVYPQNTGEPILDEEELKKDEHTEYGLKPYIYYSCRYAKGNKDFVVNYTLDNAITLYGDFGDGDGYKTLSGYLINSDAVEIKSYENQLPQNWLINYNADGAQVEIGPEILTEHLLFVDKEEDGSYKQGEYTYLVYNGQKIYYDKDRAIQKPTETKYFRYQNYTKTYLTNSYANKDLIEYLRQRTGESFSLESGDVTYFNADGNLHSTSSIEYYAKAKQFTEKVRELTRGITQENAVDEEGNPVDFEAVLENAGYVNTGDDEIFYADNQNDPLLVGSTFNENRRMVIRKSIKTNLATAIANYNMYSGKNYEFTFPELLEVDWEKITSKISVTAFLQGFSIGHKVYNNYCVITNNNNEETIDEEGIYMITENTVTKEREYHLPGCTYLAKPEIETNLKIVESYSNLSFLRQTVRIAEGDYTYFYPQTRNKNGSLVNITSCYHCIVNASNVYMANEIIKGRTDENNQITREDFPEFNIRSGGAKNERMKSIREIYLRALARERYDLYRANIDAFNDE